MNKLYRAGSLLCLVLLLGGCGGQKSNVNQIVNAQIDAENSGDAGNIAAAATRAVRETAGQAAAGAPGSGGPEASADEAGDTATGAAGALPTGAAGSGIDVDLTQMSSVMVYSEVYNIMMNPEAYLGQTIKIEGPYYASFWEETGNYYHYVIIEDAAACCTQGLEFIWGDGAHAYPEEYPEDYTEVEIVGTFSMYEEEGMTFYYLDTDEIVLKQ